MIKTKKIKNDQHTNNKSFYIQIITSKNNQKKYPILDSYKMKNRHMKSNFSVLIININ